MPGVDQVLLSLPQDTMGHLYPCESLLGETARSESFRLSGTGLSARCIVSGT